MRRAEFHMAHLTIRTISRCLRPRCPPRVCDACDTLVTHTLPPSLLLLSWLRIPGCVVCLPSININTYYSGVFHRLPPQVLTVASEASTVASSSALLSSPPTLPSAGVHADAAARAELARLARELLEAREDLQRDEGGCAPKHPMRRAVVFRCPALFALRSCVWRCCASAHRPCWDIPASQS